MEDILGRVFDFERSVFPDQSALYGQLATHGQAPRALMISCADSRIVPEHILRADPGDLFVCRNAGNIVPPFQTQNGGVSSTVEYGVMALGVRELIVCGHSDCGAMKGLFAEGLADKMPNVAAWLRHSRAAHNVVEEAYPALDPKDKVRAVSLENIVLQLNHLRTHPSVAAGIARGELALHGWFVDIHAGTILALDGETNQFVQVSADRPLPVALPRGRRLATSGLDATQLAAAE